MGKLILKLVAGCIAACALMVGLLAVALPRLIDSDEFRMTLRKSATNAFGTPVEWQALEAGLLPPRLTIHSVVFSTASGNPQDARLTAESVDLRLAFFPIFAKHVQVDSLILRGVELVVTRTPEGFLLPIAEEDKHDSDASASMNTDDSGDEEAFDLAIRRIVISNSRIILRDRTLQKPIEWHFEDLQIDAFAAEGGSDAEAMAIELVANVQLGGTAVGRIQLGGMLSLRGLYDLEIEVEKIRLEEFQPYVADATLSGMMSGRVSLDGSTSALSEIDLDLRIEMWAMRTLGIDFAGGLAFQANQTLGDPAVISAVLDLETGGRVEMTGELSGEGAIDATLKLDELDLAWAAPLLPDGSSLEGEVSGEIAFRTTEDRRLERFETELQIASARFVRGPVDVSGMFGLVASLDGDGPIHFDVGLEFSRGGRLDLIGTSTREGVLDLRAEIESFDLTIVKPFLPDPDMELAGLATGDAQFVGDAVSPEFISLDVAVASGLLRMSDYFVEGPFLATLKLDDPFSDRPKGQIDLDLTTARLEYQGRFKKPAGKRAEMTTKFVLEESGEIIFESRIKFHDIDEILLQGAIGESTSVEWTTSTLDLERWSDVLPALESDQLDGIVKLRGVGFELVDDSPRRFSGRLDLVGL